MTEELSPEEIVLRHGRISPEKSPQDPSAKLPGIHGEGLGTGLPNDGDYSDLELRALKFLSHVPWVFDDSGHVWGPWMQENHSSAFPVHYRTCVHPRCSAVDRKGPPDKPVPS
jgi:hypothetical protein